MENVTRRKACALITGMAATALWGKAESAGHQHEPGMIGCHVPASFNVNNLKLLKSFGNARDDEIFRGEYLQQLKFFGQADPKNGLPTRIFIYQEKNPNNENALTSPQGWIAFGYYLFHHHAKLHGLNGIASTLAHEFGHRVAFAYGWKYPSIAHEELESDAWSAYYMVSHKKLTRADTERLIEHVYSGGDNDFNSPDFHGTGEQRLDATVMGANVLAYSIKNNRVFTATELHTIFQKVIVENIIGTSPINPNPRVPTNPPRTAPNPPRRAPDQVSPKPQKTLLLQIEI